MEDVKRCLNAAVDVVGMRILHVEGLAAFSYRCDALRSIGGDGNGDGDGGGGNGDGADYHDGDDDNTPLHNTVTTPTSIVTGSIKEKVAGLDAAFRIARNSLPCVLHVCLDGEFSGDGNDNSPNAFGSGGGDSGGGGGDMKEERHDEEERFVSSIREGLLRIMAATATITKLKGGNDDEEHINKMKPLLFTLVLSSSKILPSGPLSRASSYETIPILSPDRRYAKELWSQDSSFEMVAAHIDGRSSTDVLHLRRRYDEVMFKNVDENGDRYKSGSESEGNDDAAIIVSLIKELDDRASLLWGDGKTLKPSLVPDVRWEDIGGLTHVRREVRDAIGEF